MKFCFFLSLLGFLLGSQPVFSQQDPMSVPLSREVATQLLGAGRRSMLNCQILLTKTWAYPNAQVFPFCNEAETSCLRYDMIKSGVANAKGPALENLKRELLLAQEDVMLKLRGCQLALEANYNNSDFVQGIIGGPAYQLHRR